MKTNFFKINIKYKLILFIINKIKLNKLKIILIKFAFN